MIHRLFLFFLISFSLVVGASAGMVVREAFAPDYTDVSVTEAKTMVDENSYLVVLDVRNQSEYDSGHIRNAKLIPVWQLTSRLNELNKSAEILVYCKVGARSASASLTLADNGFSHVYHMLGGIDAWISNNYPLYIKYPSIQEAINNATKGDKIRISSGLYYEHLTIGKPLTLEGEDKNTTIVDGGGTGNVFDVMSENVTITGFTIQGSGCSCAEYAGICARPESRNLNLTRNAVVNNGYGILVVNASNFTLDNNEVTNNTDAIEIRHSSNNAIIGNRIKNNMNGLRLNPSFGNIITGNSMTNNTDDNVMLRYSSNGNIFKENKLVASWCGIRLYSSFNNTFEGNMLAHHKFGIDTQNATGNSFYKNSFTDNDQHIQFFEGSHALLNTWDNGNITGGNFWSNYTGIDSNHDGIGDSPQILGSNNQDNYPLMGMLCTFSVSGGSVLEVTSNSTVENLQYFSSSNTIKMHVTNMNENHQHGFCRLTIPKTVLPPPYTITINDDPVDCINIYENATITIIYFSYRSIYQSIEILVIPEVWSLPSIVLLCGATLLILATHRGRRTHTSIDRV